MLRNRKYRFIMHLNKQMKQRKQLIKQYALAYQNQAQPTDNDEDQDYDPKMEEVPDIPLEILPFLSSKERKQYQKQFPNLPPYLFMNQKEKRKFFENKGKEYKLKLENAPTRKSKTKKIVKFRQNFCVKPFKNSQKASKVNQAKPVKDKYQQYHFSS